MLILSFTQAPVNPAINNGIENFLPLRREPVHLVKKQNPPVRFLHESRFIFSGPGKGAPDVPK